MYAPVVRLGPRIEPGSSDMEYRVESEECRRGMVGWEERKPRRRASRRVLQVRRLENIGVDAGRVATSRSVVTPQLSFRHDHLREPVHCPDLPSFCWLRTSREQQTRRKRAVIQHAEGLGGARRADRGG